MPSSDWHLYRLHRNHHCCTTIAVQAVQERHYCTTVAV
jgi:hypothetical protein